MSFNIKGKLRIMKSFSEFLVEAVENKSYNANPLNLGEAIKAVTDEKSFFKNKSIIRKFEKSEYDNDVSTTNVVADAENYVKKLSKRFADVQFVARYDVDFSETERTGYVFAKAGDGYIMLRSFHSVSLDNAVEDSKRVGNDDFSYQELDFINKNQFSSYMTKSAFISEYGTDKEFQNQVNELIQDSE